MITETEFFDDIFENFVCLEETYHDNEIWKSNSIIKLMKASKEIQDKQILEEGLKIILSLCKFRENGYLIDFYELESYPSSSLMESDKNSLDSILKAEFI